MANKRTDHVKKTLVSKFQTFCKESTLHGFYYFHKSSKWNVRLVWAIIIMASVSLCTFLSNMIWTKYVVDPTFTVVETTHYPMADIAFPAVAVCDSNLVYGPKTGNISEILLKRGYSGAQIEEFFQSIGEVRRPGYEAAPFVAGMHALLHDLGYPIYTLYDLLKKPCENMLVTCFWRSHLYNCSQMFRSIMTLMGHCCQFNMDYFRMNAVNKNITFVSGIQDVLALQVTVDERNIASDGTVTNGLVFLYIFDHKDTITFFDNPVFLTSLTYYDIDIEVWAIDSSDNVKELPLSVRRCLLDTDMAEGASFFKGCISTLLVREVVKQCNCIPFNFTAEKLQVNFFMPCTWEQTNCVYRVMERTMPIINRVSYDTGCYERCDYIQYETEVRYIRESRIDQSLNKYHGRFAVHFADNSCMKYKRQVLYTWDQMMANLGGIFGLCLGGSIISLIEVAWFVVELLLTVLTGFRKRKVEPKKFDQKVFATNLTPLKFRKSEKRLPFIH